VVCSAACRVSAIRPAYRAGRHSPCHLSSQALAVAVPAEGAVGAVVGGCLCSHSSIESTATVSHMSIPTSARRSYNAWSRMKQQ
jgi:hypothetical protein